MDNTIDSESLSISELEKQAEALFPYPIGVCPYVRMKIDWKRKEWIKKERETIQ